MTIRGFPVSLTRGYRSRYIRIDDPDEPFWGWIDTNTRQYIIDGAVEELFYRLTEMNGENRLTTPRN